MEAPQFSPDNSPATRAARMHSYLSTHVDDSTFLDEILADAFRTPVVRELPKPPPRPRLYLVESPPNFDPPNTTALRAA